MAISNKHAQNLQRIQDVLDDKHDGKIQVGYSKSEKERKVGDKWTDSDGKEWIQKKGYRESVSILPAKGIADKCEECGTFCFQAWDSSTQKRYGRCYYCQLDWEVDMKGKRIGINGNKWQHWVRLQQLRDMDAIERELESEIDEISRIRNLEDKPFDTAVANALANSNVEESIQKNKILTGG